MHDISEFAKLFKKMFDRVCKRDRAADICAKRGKIAAKMKFAQGPGPSGFAPLVSPTFRLGDMRVSNKPLSGEEESKSGRTRKRSA